MRVKSLGTVSCWSANWNVAAADNVLLDSGSILVGPPYPRSRTRVARRGCVTIRPYACTRVTASSLGSWAEIGKAPLTRKPKRPVHKELERRAAPSITILGP